MMFADFHPATKLCVHADGHARTIHARTLGDCLADLVEAIVPIGPYGTLPETEIENFGCCLADARNAGMDVRYHAAWDPLHNRWVLTLHVRAATNRYRVAKAVLPLLFEQFCLLAGVLKLNQVPEARNA
jgi:hypothetical protein